MRFRYWEKKKDDWERWFAWYPVPIGGYPRKDGALMVWLEVVERKWLDCRESNRYNYRFIKPAPTKAGSGGKKL